MLCAYIFVLFLLGHETLGAAPQKPDEEHLSDRLSDVIKEKCLRNADQIKTEAALNGLEYFLRRWVVERPGRKLSHIEFYESCMTNAQNFTSYLDDFVETLKPCLEPEENYLPQFLIDSYGNYNHHFCAYLSAAVRTSSTSRTTIDKCIESFEQHKEMDPRITCYKDSEILGDDSTVDVITKKELCSDIRSLLSCHEQVFDQHCASPEYRNWILSLLKNALGNCSADNNSPRKV